MFKDKQFNICCKEANNPRVKRMCGTVDDKKVARSKKQYAEDKKNMTKL